MILLVAFAFLAGIVTILSPCILPILPIILSSSIDTTGKRRPFGVVVGFVLSFTFFTLFLSTIVKLSGIPAESLRFLSIFILAIFGLSLFVPKVQLVMEQLFSRLTRFAPNGQTKHGFFGGLIIGLSLGLLWTPCVGPILASVISLAITGSVNTQVLVITFAYSLGTAIPMFMIMQAGYTTLHRVPWLLQNSAKIQKAFGVLMVATAIGIFFNIDRKFQTFVLDTFPQYGVGLTKFEDNKSVKQELEKMNQKPTNEIKTDRPIAPELIPGGVWFNSTPLTVSSLKGKVVLIDFWTYSCINCQRTIPYLKKWWEKYKDQGLVIIGVHTPEFEFEKGAKNVADAIKDFGITYPVVQDNNYATWNAYNNHYWPAKYFIDKNGSIAWTHFGEGQYDESEKMIQTLLGQTTQKIDNPTYQVYANTPETYLGYKRIDRFASIENISEDKVSNYSYPAILSQNYFAFSGNWNISEEFAKPEKGAMLRFSFDAKNVYLVMRPTNTNPKVKVLLDGQKTKIITINKDMLYELIKLETPGSHELELQFIDGEVEVYAFTFG